MTELLVVMMLASILMLAIGTMFVSSLRQNRTVTGKTTSTADARIAMEAMTRELRVATVPPGQPAAIVSASPTAVTFYSSIGASTQTTDPRPSLVTLRIDSTNRCLWREMTPATVEGTTWSWPTTNKVQGCVARGDIASPLFTYYPINPDDTISTTAFATSALSANLANIVAVGLSLSVTDTFNPGVLPTSLQDQVTLINIATAKAG
jgi:type II secretory pathway pseudopilin PulG